MQWSDTQAKTDGTCLTAGIYRSDCSDEERVTLVAGETFPKCPSCRKPVGWRLAAAT
jgi:hypothetical protein